jgi:DNA-binding response OmpR family regulator
LTGYLINIFEEIEVTCCYDGGKALHNINFHNYDYIFFDLNIPKIDGVDLIKETRNRENNENTEIYVISGNIDHMAKKCLMELHTRGALHRPFTYEDICEMIDSSHVVFFIIKFSFMLHQDSLYLAKADENH